MMGARRVLGVAAGLFDFKNLDNLVRGELPQARLGSGVLKYAIGIFLFLLTSFLLTTISIVYLMLTYEAMAGTSLVVTAKPAITSGFIISSLIYFGLALFPFLFLGSFLHQGVVYLMMRVLGGRGSFATQYYLNSYITLALGAGSLGFVPVFIISIFLPCFNLFFLLVYFIAMVYLAIYVQARMLMASHRANFAPSLVVAIIISIGSLAAYAVFQLLLIKAGIGPDFTATFNIAGINTSTIGVNVTGLPNMSGLPNISTNNTIISGLAANFTTIT